MYLHSMKTIAFLFSMIIPLTSTAQNVTPKPDKISIDAAEAVKKKPTPLRGFQLNSNQIVGGIFEAISESRIIFSEYSTAQSANHRLFVWDINEAKLYDTLEDGISGTVIMPKHGKYMIFIHNELMSGRDINGDGIQQVVLRFYHFDSAQRVNLGIPARRSSELSVPFTSQYEYFLENDILTYPVSQLPQNTKVEKDAPWNIVNMMPLLYAIEGTPTPTPSPIPTHTPSPTLPPFTPTPTVTPTPDMRTKADINGDGVVNTLDLLILQSYLKK